jgi:hypothetical protein
VPNPRKIKRGQSFVIGGYTLSRRSSAYYAPSPTVAWGYRTAASVLLALGLYLPT